MNQRTLVLNKQWVPVKHINWRRGFILSYCLDKAEVLEYYDYVIKTSSEDFFVPAVIKLHDYNKIPKMKIKYSKREVFKRDNYKCQYCFRQLSLQSATIDHIVPRHLGGANSYKNTVTSCFPCNNKKGSRLLENTDFILRKKPVAPSYFGIAIEGYIEEEWKPYLPKGFLNVRD